MPDNGLSTQLIVPESLFFRGPHRMSPQHDYVGRITNAGGVYLWCVKAPEGYYRVHYIGEGRDIRRRTAEHIKMQLGGKNHAFDPDGLRSNLKLLVHRAGVGLVGKYRDLNVGIANSRYVECLRLFYAELPSHYRRSDRCFFETALAHSVEDYGQNVLAVSHLNKPRVSQVPVKIDTPDVDIEALTGTTILV